MPKFSIIVPVYNVEKYISTCLDSILNQTVRDFEVICIDDCGIDNSIAIINKYMQKDNRIRLISHMENQGLSGARNTGIKNSTGEYVIFIDSDDWIEVNLLEYIQNIFERYSVDSVWYNAKILFENKNIWSYIFNPKVFLLKEGWMNITPKNIHKLPDYAWNKAFRRDIIEKFNLYFTEGIYFEDAEFHLRAFCNIKRIYYTNTMLYNYRHREGSIVTSDEKSDMKFNDLFKIIELNYDYLVANNKFEEYKEYLLHTFNNRMRSVLVKNKKTLIMNLAQNTLSHIKFPNAYKSLEKIID